MNSSFIEGVIFAILALIVFTAIMKPELGGDPSNCSVRGNPGAYVCD